jgi:O-antigen/teichoic acid export membrane protein
VTNSTTAQALRWARLLASPLGAAALTSIAALAGNALLYRNLPDADAGAFALLTSLIQTVLVIGGLGQSTLTQRVYSRNEPGAFRWRADLTSQLALTLPVTLALTLLVAWLYKLPFEQAAFVLAGGLAWTIIGTMATMLASHRHYALASTLPRLPNGLLLIPALLITLAPALQTLPVAAVGLTLAAGASLGVGWWGLVRLRATGWQRISLQQRGYGLVFLASQMTSLVPDYLLLAAAAFFAPPEDLALYAALALLFRPTQLLQNVLAQVMVTELARGERPRLRRLLTLFAGATALLIGGGILLAGPVTHFAYAGRYTPSLLLIAGISIASGLDVLETLPRSYLVGRGSRRALGWFGVSQVLIALAGMAFGLALVAARGIEGAAIGAALIFVARNLASFAGFAMVRLQERRRNRAQ